MTWTQYGSFGAVGASNDQVERCSTTSGATQGGISSVSTATLEPEPEPEPQHELEPEPEPELGFALQPIMVEDKGWGLGQAEWHVCQIECDAHGILTLRRPRGVAESHATLRGCRIQDVKNPRKHHPGAFRLCLSKTDSAGASEYVVAGCTTRGLTSAEWRAVLLAQRGTSVAGVGVSSMLHSPGVFDVVQMFQPRCRPNVQLVVGTMGIQIFDGPHFIVSHLYQDFPAHGWVWDADCIASAAGNAKRWGTAPHGADGGAVRIQLGAAMSRSDIRVARASGEWASGSGRLLVLGVESEQVGQRLVSQISIQMAKHEDAETEARRQLERAAGGLFQRFLRDAMSCSAEAIALGCPEPLLAEPYADNPIDTSLVGLLSLLPPASARESKSGDRAGASIPSRSSAPSSAESGQRDGE